MRTNGDIHRFAKFYRHRCFFIQLHPIADGIGRTPDPLKLRWILFFFCSTTGYIFSASFSLAPFRFNLAFVAHGHRERIRPSLEHNGSQLQLKTDEESRQA